MGKKEIKINLLIELFKSRKSMTLDEIQEELAVNLRYARLYLAELRKLGLNIVCRKGVCRLVSDGDSDDGNNGEKVIHMDILSKQDLRRLKLIHIISQSKGIKREEIVEKFLKYNAEKKVSSKTIKRDIEDSLSKGEIYKDNDKYYVSSHIRTLERINTVDLDEFISVCNSYGSNVPFYKELAELRDRLMTEGDYYGYTNEIYSIGRKYKDTMSINKFFEFIENIDYRKKTVYVEYMSRIGIIKTDIQIVILLYSWDKDKGYIIGKVDENVYFINVDTIKVFVEKDIPNKYYKDKEIMDKVKMMFGISMDGPYDVRVEFDNVYNIYEKLQRIEERRESASVQPNGDKLLIYKDTIYGLSDLANYLRRFGSSCRVLEPQELKDMMFRSCKRILENYEVISHE